MFSYEVLPAPAHVLAGWPLQHPPPTCLPLLEQDQDPRCLLHALHDGNHTNHTMSEHVWIRASSKLTK